MAKPNSRETLIDYCKRRLGDPVVEINVDEDQLEDRVDEALEYFQEFHSDATKLIYLKHEITADDVANKYIPLNTDILFVQRMVPASSGGSSSWMGLDYQLRLNDLSNMATYSGDMTYYNMMKTHVQMLNNQLNGLPQVSFSHHENRLYIHGEFESEDIKAGEFIIVEALQLVDPDTNTSVYNDKFVKEYTTQLIKQQWGTNLSKFEGMQLPGGVTMNGLAIYEQATQEIEKLREQVRMEHEMPTDFFVG